MRANIGLLINCVLKDLKVREHPVTIPKEDRRRVAEVPDEIDHHPVIHLRWLAVCIRNLVPLHGPKDKVGEEGDWEK